MRFLVAVPVMTLMLVMPASAHHSLALFDTVNLVTLQGRVTRV